MHDDHGGDDSARSERRPYLDFVDELFRLKLIDGEKRNFLREGVHRAGTGDAAPIVQPASTHSRVSEAGL